MIKALQFTTEHIKSFIAILVVIASFFYFFVTYFVGKGQADPQIIIAIVAALTQVLNYYFGSSQQATKQNETIANMVQK
jgi:hypothetical protein